MHILLNNDINKGLGFTVGKVMRNGLCMMMCDIPGGRLFTYLDWESKKKAIEIEVYATDPVVVPVTLGKEVKTLVLSRKQIMLLYGRIQEEVDDDASLEEVMDWIEQSGGFHRDHYGNWRIG
jgi:hypothetical protein